MLEEKVIERMIGAARNGLSDRGVMFAHEISNRDMRHALVAVFKALNEAGYGVYKEQESGKSSSRPSNL